MIEEENAYAASFTAFKHIPRRYPKLSQPRRIVELSTKKRAR
jgi:hypothetical protein